MRKMVGLHRMTEAALNDVPNQAVLRVRPGHVKPKRSRFLVQKSIQLFLCNAGTNRDAPKFLTITADRIQAPQVENNGAF